MTPLGQILSTTDVELVGDPPTDHALSHVFGGTDEINTPLSPAAYPMEAGTLAEIPVAANLGRVYWTTDEHVLYRGDGTFWVKAAVADYADLTSIPATFAPSAHASEHDYGGGDPMIEDGNALRGTLRTLGTGALQATAGNDARLSDARTPTAHATTHANGGGDELISPLDERAIFLNADIIANIPAAATLGRLFWATDTHVLYKGDGTFWAKVAVADYADLDDISVVNADVANDAAIVYSKLSLAASIKDSDMSTVLADRPVGDVLTHNEFTANVTISGATEALATTVVTATAVACDGVTPIMIEFFSQRVQPSSNATDYILIILFQNGSAVGQLGTVLTPAANTMAVPVHLRRRMIPTNASHTFSVRAFRSTANGTIYGGAGGAATSVPGFIRITKA